MTASTPRLGGLGEILAMPGPLSEKLQAYSAVLRSEDSMLSAQYDALTARLRAGRVGELAPAPGEPMLPFLLPDPQGRFVSSADLLAEGPLVVSFNRGHWCPYCQIELDALSAAADAVSALGGRIVSIMPDRAGFTAPLMRVTGGQVSILTDEDSGYALEVGLVLFIGETIRDLMIREGVHLDKVQGNESWFMPLPATFVVDRDGTVTARHVDPDFRTRMEVDAILDTLSDLRRRPRPTAR